jgi:hypothetical protein
LSFDHSRYCTLKNRFSEPKFRGVKHTLDCPMCRRVLSVVPVGPFRALFEHEGKEYSEQRLK